MTTTTTTDLAVSPRQLQITDQSRDVRWTENNDLTVGLHLARSRVYLPSTAETGHVLVALNLDGEDLDEVHTDPRIGVTNVALIDEAIEVLTLVRSGIVEATR